MKKNTFILVVLLLSGCQSEPIKKASLYEKEQQYSLTNSNINSEKNYDFAKKIDTKIQSTLLDRLIIEAK